MSAKPEQFVKIKYRKTYLKKSTYSSRRKTVKMKTRKEQILSEIDKEMRSEKLSII